MSKEERDNEYKVVFHSRMANTIPKLLKTSSHRQIQEALNPKRDEWREATARYS